MNRTVSEMQVTVDHPVEEPLYEVKPRQGLIRFDWEELWLYRELFYFLVWRDILVRYKQTVLGVAWAVIQPLAAMVLFTIIFGRLAKIPSEGLPYPVFSYAGLVVWSFFSHSMNQASLSLVSDAKLITKIYFPRLFIPMAPVASTLVDLAIALVLLFCLLPIYGVFPSRNIWAVPLMLMLVVVTAAGVGLWLSALNIKYRDFRYAVPFGIQLWLFASPVVYPASLVPEKWRPLYSINPMVGAIEGFRWALLGTEINLWPSVGVSALFAILIVLTGAMYFRNTERFFADLV